MILTILSSTQDFDFLKIQSIIKNKFKNNVKISCNFIDNDCNHSYNEISVLFAENSIKVFYASPRFDAFDEIVSITQEDYQSFLLDICNEFCDDISMSSHLIFPPKSAPFRKIINLFPEEYLNKENYSKSISALSEHITCSIHIVPNEHKNNILINFETYNSKISTVSNFKEIDNTEPFNKDDSLINNFFNLLTFLYNNERNEVVNG